MKKALPLVLILLSGCATFSYRTADVSFEDPLTRLEIVTSEPTLEERSGVLLRMNAPPDGKLRFREETRLYVQIKENRGKEVRLDAARVETYKPGASPETYLLRAESNIDGHAGAIVEEAEVTTRGEIVKFIQGRHDSKEGKFDITAWTRTPVFPENPARTGDSWNYEETMAMKIDSFWVKQKDNVPYRLDAKSTLTGFAQVKGVRCAVIETEAKQIQTQRMKVLWKDVLLYIRANIRETTYLDYQGGKVLGRITRAETFTNSADSKVNDHSLSQTVSIPVS